MKVALLVITDTDDTVCLGDSAVHVDVRASDGDIVAAVRQVCHAASVAALLRMYEENGR